MTHKIYVIEHIASGKTYVGRSCNVDTRIKAHFRWPNPDNAIGRAIMEHGESAFVVRKVDHANSTIESALRERLFIHLLESNVPRFGYNHPRLHPLGQSWTGRYLQPE